MPIAMNTSGATSLLPPESRGNVLAGAPRHARIVTIAPPIPNPELVRAINGLHALIGQISMDYKEMNFHQSMNGGHSLTLNKLGLLHFNAQKLLEDLT